MGKNDALARGSFISEASSFHSIFGVGLSDFIVDLLVNFGEYIGTAFNSTSSPSGFLPVFALKQPVTA